MTYVLEEAINSSFSASSVVYSVTSLGKVISGKNNGSYYYRVKATRSGYTDSSWRAGGSCDVTLSPKN